MYNVGELAKFRSIEIFNALEKLFNNYKIPIGNIFAACFDGCPTMIGRISGLQSLFSVKITGIIIVRCLAHVTHLCARHAIKHLPSSEIDLLTNIYTMLKSSKREKNFENIQIKIGLPTHKILK